MARCPVCRRTVAPREGNEAFPFCSPRCRLIDLGKWLGGEYRIAGRAEENEDELPLPREAGGGKDDDGDAA